MLGTNVHCILPENAGYERAPMPTIGADEFKKYKSTVLNGTYVLSDGTEAPCSG